MLYSILTMEMPQDHVVSADIKLFFEKGFAHFMATDEELLVNGSERLRAAYKYSWKDVRELLFGQRAAQSEVETPREQLESIFSRIYEARGTEREECLTFAFTLRHGHNTSPMVHEILYEGKDEHPYDDETIIQQIEEICWVAGFSEQPHYVAEAIMNYMETVHMTHITMPMPDPNDNLSLDDALIGLRQIFEKVS